jgi:glucose-1-phosphate cytidylyltransferase
MKVVILAGGFGTRLAELTHSIPKPMVPIGDKPILHHIINYYQNFGINDFIIAGGYKIDIIHKYFKNLKKNFNIEIVDTGDKTMTGGRLKRVESYLDNDIFFLTYGDGLCDININELYQFHKTNHKLVTVTAVRPPARFGSLQINNDNIVERFREKSQLDEGWINGGYFVMNKKFINYIDNDNTILEKEPLEKLTKEKELTAFKHYGFWQCMDHLTDKKYLEKLFNSNSAPWQN